MMEELPKKLNKREQSITPAVMKWFKDNYHGDVAIEIKVKGNKEKKHQTAALAQVANSTFIHKLADTGRRQPFDIIMLKYAVPFTVTCEGKKCVALNKRDNTSFDFHI